MIRSRLLVPAAVVAFGGALGWWTASNRMGEALAQESKVRPLTAAGEQLPKPDPEFQGKIGENYKDSTPSYPQPVRAPKGSPNVLLILLDDVGFGMCSTFGGPVPTPNMDKLANNGLKYTRFHTTALCSPTRAALLAGRNHHTCGTGVIIEMGTGYPGYTGIIPRSTALVSEILRDNGYATGCFGKWHNTPEPDISPAGPFDRWPTGLGFDYFYGFNQGETHQYYPVIYRNTSWMPQPRTPEQGYHFTADMTDEAIAWTRNVRAADRDKPWFVYFSTAGVHAPHHAPKAWREQYKGRFDHGWDRQRELTYAKQLEMGVIPKGTKLTPRPESIPSWDSRSADEKKVYARLMENYAAYMAYTDAEVGRLIDSLAASGELDNTLVMYVVGDNGASAEGGSGGDLQRDRQPDRGTAWADEHDQAARRDRRAHQRAARPGRLGVGDGRALPVDQASRQPLRRHTQPAGRPLAEGYQGEGGDPHPVPPRHRRRANDPGGVQDPATEGGRRHPAEADRGRLDALLVRRREREGAADDAVLRAGHEPGDLSRRLGGVQSLRAALGHRRPGRRLPGRPLGAVPRRGGLQSGRQSSGDDARQGERVTGKVRRGGEDLRRVSARPAVLGATRPEAPRGRRAAHALDLLR